MATGRGLNIGGYGATPGCLGAAFPLPTARRSSRRGPGGRVSGHQTRRCRRPLRSTQERKASGPRHCSCRSWIGWPLRVAANSLPGKTKLCVGKCACFHACHALPANTANANGQVAPRGISETITENAASKPRQSSAPIAQRGISETSTENAASTPRYNKAPISQREGRHSSRQLTDLLDEWCECVMRTLLVAHEPAPELIVLAIQQL